MASAIVLILRARAIETIALTTSWSTVLLRICRMKLSSILRKSIGRSLSCVIEENPTPKSSIEKRHPMSLRLRMKRCAPATLPRWFCAMA